MKTYDLTRVMKLTCLLIIGLMTISAFSYSQTITLKGKNIPFPSVMDAVRKQSGYTVFGAKKLLESIKPITIDATNLPLQEFMDKVIENQPIRYVIEDKTISISSRPGQPITKTPGTTGIQNSLLIGSVRHAETKAPLENVTVKLKGTALGTMTNARGEFRLNIPASDKKQTLAFSFVGMKLQEIVYQKQERLDVELEPEQSNMSEILVTGIYQRERNQTTGSAARFELKDLQVVGNQNILQSLKTLDPSFAIIENNTFGSDPNRLPDIEIRGKSSVIGLTDEFATNPNQPLFILDGFESTLAIIADLSMDRVESITLLKDAAATAIYGSKSANGVVVIETKRPTPGKLRINYNFSSTVNFADLSDYNLMNASEKLQFELLSGFYGLLNADGKIIVGANETTEGNYNNRMKEVARGVDTYWANEPLRTAITQRHTLFAEGGDANLRYSTSFSYGLTPGVMEGSERQVTNGNIRLLYRKGNFSVNNSLSIDNVRADKEPIPFSEFSRANPYQRKYDANGNLNRVLENYIYSDNLVPVTVKTFSPLYNQDNLNVDREQTQGFTNNLEMEWRLMQSLRLRGRFGIRSSSTQSKVFRSPYNTEFEYTDPLEKGKYDESNGKTNNYDGDLALTFGKLLAEKHMINGVAGIRMEQATKVQSAYQVRGFIDDEFANPNFALGYPEGQGATYQESKRRGGSFFINMGYAYDQRYLVDLTMRSDGSSVYGSDKQFSTIWSVGLAWNITNEELFKRPSLKWVNQLRLRGSIGNPGNQNFDDYISMRIYRYNNDNRNQFGASTLIDNIGNSNLKWQTTLDKNIGLDLATLDNRFHITADYFVKNTDPLLVYVTLPSSTGISRVARNIGEQITEGFTISTDYAVIRKNQFNWRVNLNMRQLKAEYAKMDNQLSNFNKENQSRNLSRYYDGGSPADLWAVRSLGIDPATGREIFLNKNNEQTFVYNYDDEVVVGNSDPDLEGVVGTNLNYKGFIVSLNVRFRFGGQAFMKTLYEKVENITAANVTLNQDKRALYDRWQKPGDNALFKAISRTESTPISSRFVEDNNMLVGEAFSIGYETSNQSWLKTIRASSISFRAYMNDIFYLSTIKNERGLDYPFARSVSFSAAIRF